LSSWNTPVFLITTAGGKNRRLRRIAPGRHSRPPASHTALPRASSLRFAMYLDPCRQKKACA